MRWLLLGLLSLTACDGDPNPSGKGPGDADVDTDTDEDWSGIRITSPVEGEGFYRDVPTTWEVRDFTIDEAAEGGARVDGVGHVHVYLDTVYIGEAGAGGWTYTDLGGGGHTLEVRLAQNDHTELRLTDWVYVEARSPEILVTDPVDGAVLVSSSAPVAMQVTDFELVDEMGEEPRFGKGHYVVRVDGEPRVRGTDPLSALLTRLTEGEHEVDVELVANDDTSLVPQILSPPVHLSVAPASPFLSLGEGYGASWDSATLPVSAQILNFVGHYHLYLDATWAGEGLTPTLSVRHLAPGRHVIRAVLATDSHSEVGTVDVIDAIVTEDRPDVRVTYPGEGWSVSDGFELSLSTENFTLDPGFPGAAVDDHGHVDLSVDGVRTLSVASASTPVSGLTPGVHTLRLTLVGNDGVSLDPPVWDEITLTVK